MFTAAITRLRAPLMQDDYATTATTRDWANAVPVTLQGFMVDPGNSTELTTVNRQQVTTTPTLYFTGTIAPDILATDRVRDHNGATWEVTGNRADWSNPFTGWHAGYIWPLRRVEG